VGGLLFFEGDAAHRILLVSPTEFPNVHLREELASCERFNSHTLNAVPAPPTMYYRLELPPSSS